jgi:hypothetical protein
MKASAKIQLKTDKSKCDICECVDPGDEYFNQVICGVCRSKDENLQVISSTTARRGMINYCVRVFIILFYFICLFFILVVMLGKGL